MNALRCIGACFCLALVAGCGADLPAGAPEAGPGAASADPAPEDGRDPGPPDPSERRLDSLAVRTEESSGDRGRDSDAPSPTMPSSDSAVLAIEYEWVDPLDPGESVVVRAVDDVLVARAAPDRDAEPVAALPNPTARGGPLVVAAVDPAAAEDADWIEVRLPVRPNESTGWVRSTDVELFRNPYSIEVSTSGFELTVFKHASPIVVAEIAVGRDVAPTPHGEFFVAELLQPESPDGPYGPFAFGLSAFSDVYTEFAGGDGVIGIHGTDAPGLLGTEASHGCVRVDNATIETLAALIPLGTPVTVVA